MIFKVRPLIIEQVRLENGKINKNGALFEVIWFNTGDYEIHALKPVKTISQVWRIPFNPNYPRYRNGEDVDADNRWGDRMDILDQLEEIKELVNENKKFKYKNIVNFNCNDIKKELNYAIK